MFRASCFAALVCALAVMANVPIHAQSTSGNGSDFGGPPPPIPPEVVAFDSDGRATLRATRINEVLKIDGKMDESVYERVKPVTGFVQSQPNYGGPGSADTEAWILFDDQNLYITCRCGQDPQYPLILDDMRRDVSNQGDFFSVSFDTFLDRRNSYLFYMNPIGGLYDALTTDERVRNDSWNGVWDAKTSQVPGGWIGEMVIPFKSLRYRPGRDQVWGVILRRRIRANGDEHVWVPLLPQAWGPGAVTRISRAATLVGLEAPPPALNLEIKPYATTTLRTDLLASPRFSNDPGGDVGLDVKYGVTKSLTLDATYNTDFAQVEVDQTQINLTRFSLFYPEKREFFLEGQGLFAFGGTGTERGASVVPVMFFSRQIGLHQGRLVPIVGGARATGRAGRYSIGVLGITTDDDAATGVRQASFDVVRVKRDIFRNSTIGALVTHRSTSLTGAGSNQLYGIDALFSFYENLSLSTYAAKTNTASLTGDDLSFRAQLDYNADRYGLQVERLTVDDNFNPEVGFMRREDFRRNFVAARFSPRPRREVRVRKYYFQSGFDYITDNQNTLESRSVDGSFRIEFRNSDQLSAEYNRNYELIERPFTISEGVRVPSGGYHFQNVRLAYTAGQQHRLSGTSAVERGGFYGGTKTSAAFQGRVKFGIRLSLEPNVSIDWIDLLQASVVTKVVSTRGTYNFTPRMFFGALVQYNSTSTSFSANLRLRWEYQPGSELFVVYTEGRDTFPAGRLPLENRGVAVKLTRLFRF